MAFCSVFLTFSLLTKTYSSRNNDARNNDGLGFEAYCLGLGLEGYCLGQFIQDHVTLILSHFISRPHSCILARDYNNNNNNNVVYGHIDYTAITLDVLSY